MIPRTERNRRRDQTARLPGHWRHLGPRSERENRGVARDADVMDEVPVAHPCRTIVWLDRDGEFVAYWAGLTNGHDGQGWTAERQEALEYVEPESAEIGAMEARRSFGDRRERTIEVQEEV